MNFKRIDNQIYLFDNETEVGHLFFEKEKNNLIITHTFVNPLYRGQGIAKELVLETIKYAKESNHKIIPVCSYAVTFFKKYQEYQDMLSK